MNYERPMVKVVATAIGGIQQGGHQKLSGTTDFAAYGIPNDFPTAGAYEADE